MTKPPTEFIDCDLATMRRVYQENAMHVIPNCGYDIRPRIFRGPHDGGTVVALQLTHYYDGEGEPVADILRLFYAESDPIDYPLYFRFRNQVYVLTDW